VVVVYVVTFRENVACFIVWPFGSLFDTSVGLGWKATINCVLLLLTVMCSACNSIYSTGQVNGAE
jgi:hypothetical protein